MKLFIDGKLPDPLSQSELYSYFEKMQSGDTKAREIIIKHNIKLVFNEIMKRFYDAPYEKEELVSVGLIGLIKSVDTFDTSKKIQFGTYSTRCIDNEILMFLRKEKKHTNDDSLDRTLNAEDGSELRLQDVLIDENSDFAFDYEQKETYIIIRQIVEDLPNRDKEIVTLYFGFANEKSLTEKEIADKLNVSRSYISKLITKILKSIKKQLIEYGIVGPSSDEIIKTKKDKTIKKSVKEKEKMANKTIISTEEITQEQPTNDDNSSSMGKEDYIKILELIRTTSFGQLMSVLTLKEAIIVSLKLGYVDGKFFSTESIANFLGIKELEVIESTKKVLLLYQENINQFIDAAIQIAKEQPVLLKSENKSH